MIYQTIAMETDDHNIMGENTGQSCYMMVNNDEHLGNYVVTYNKY